MNYKFLFGMMCRSSLAESDVDLSIYGSTVPVLEGENLTMRVLVR